MLDVMDEYCKENGIDASGITLHCSYPGKVLDNDTGIFSAILLIIVA